MASAAIPRATKGADSVVAKMDRRKANALRKNPARYAVRPLAMRAAANPPHVRNRAMKRRRTCALPGLYAAIRNVLRSPRSALTTTARSPRPGPFRAPGIGASPVRARAHAKAPRIAPPETCAISKGDAGPRRKSKIRRGAHRRRLVSVRAPLHSVHWRSSVHSLFGGAVLGHPKTVRDTRLLYERR